MSLVVTSEITAGDYIALRRRAAGFSIADVAWKVAKKFEDRRVFANLLSEWEADLSVPSPAYLRTLQNAFRLDPYIFRQLVTSVGDPRICRARGCSALDACHDDAHRACAWATPAHDLCTTCAIRGAHPRGA